jgi:sulfotransferase 6B1
MGLRLQLSRRRWDVERFGLTPRKLVQRVHPSATSGVIANSLPQSGTHLTERALCLHPAYYRKLARVNWNDLSRLERLLDAQRPGQIVCSHTPHSERVVSLVRDRGATRVLFSFRDPRDSLVSTAHYIYGRPEHHWYPALRRYPQLRDRLSVLIEGDPASGIPPIAKPLGLYAGWLDSDCHLVRFERLVDPTTRTESLQALFGYLGTPLDAPLAEQIGGALISPASLTFRRGQIGEWQDVFDEALRSRFESVAGEWMRRYGYA